MYKILFTILTTAVFAAAAYASSPKNLQTDIQSKPMSVKKIQRMDQELTRHKALKRTFRTKKEFHQQAKRQKRVHKHISPPVAKQMRYHNGNAYDAYVPPRETFYPPMRQRGHRHSKRGWFLAYLYDRASFYDNEGFHYGYFNRYGYYFEGVFYRYDRYYTYRDRLRGRGLFDHRYYMPSNYRYYGFCDARYESRPYYRR
jgi:hypothetical protein